MCLHPLKTHFTVFYPKPENINWNEINLFIDENERGIQNSDLQLRKPLSYINHETEVPAVKFLGVYFDPALNFKNHIARTSVKLSKSLFILRKCRNLLTKQALKSLYYATFHCHLVYGILVYTCANEGALNQIIKKQKYAIRCITNSKYNAHSDPIFKAQKIMRFQDMKKFHSMQFMHDFIHDRLPHSFQNEWQSVAENNNRYPLRNSSDFIIPRYRIEKVSSLPKWSIPRFWNEFPNDNRIKDLQSKSAFTISLKRYMFSLLNNGCTQPNCYVCNRN